MDDRLKKHGERTSLTTKPHVHKGGSTSRPPQPDSETNPTTDLYCGETGCLFTRPPETESREAQYCGRDWTHNPRSPVTERELVRRTVAGRSIVLGEEISNFPSLWTGVLWPTSIPFRVPCYRKRTVSPQANRTCDEVAEKVERQ